MTIKMINGKRVRVIGTGHRDDPYIPRTAATVRARDELRDAEEKLKAAQRSMVDAVLDARDRLGDDRGSGHRAFVRSELSRRSPADAYETIINWYRE